MIYIRYKRKDTWHFHPKCQHWPTQRERKDRIRVVISPTKPKNGELCNECKRRAKKASVSQ